MWRWFRLLNIYSLIKLVMGRGWKVSYYNHNLIEKNDDDWIQYLYAHYEIFSLVYCFQFFSILSFSYYEMYKSPQTIILIITQTLRERCDEKDAECKHLVEEKKFFQLELMNRETNFNKVFNWTFTLCHFYY